MELELLKKSWETVDRRMQLTSAFNKQLVESIIASRVSTTVDSIKRLYASFYVVLIIEIIALMGVLLGNPFDFQYKLQYFPYGLLLGGVIVAFFNLFNISRSIRNLSPVESIGKYIKGIVSIYERNKRFEKWFGFIFFSIGLLVPFSFLPNKLQRMTWQGALLDTTIMIAVTLTMFILAVKLGLFRNKHKEKLEKELDEWNNLRTLANRIED